VSVVETDGVDLFFVTFDTIGGTNVVSEDPCLSGLVHPDEAECSTACKERRADCR